MTDSKGLIHSGIVGSIGQYNETEEEFECYISRMKLYFVANDVAEVKQVPSCSANIDWTIRVCLG